VDADAHASLLRCHRQILAALRGAMEHRDTADGMGWVHHERQIVANTATMYALGYGLTPVTVDDVERVETMALGHIDYAHKLALYVAEVVHGVKDPQP
jgi:diacylglycerol kinase family enzyme